MSAEKNNINEVKELVQRVRKSFWENGFFETILGGYLLSISLIMFIGTLLFLNKPSIETKNLAFIFLFLVLFGGVIVVTVYMYLQGDYWRKYIVPKTGYSKPRIARRSLIVRIFAVVVCLVFVASSIYSKVELSPGILWGGVFLISAVVMYLDFGLKRFLIGGCLAFVSGLTCALLSFNEPIQVATVFGATGISLLFTGIPKFIRFKKQPRSMT